jgi:hypothetical protein
MGRSQHEVPDAVSETVFLLQNRVRRQLRRGEISEQDVTGIYKSELARRERVVFALRKELLDTAEDLLRKKRRRVRAALQTAKSHEP